MKRVVFISVVALPFMLLGKLTTEQLDAFRLRETSGMFIGKAKIVLDGKLDEEIWQDVEWQTDLLQYNPKDGEPATYPTKFAIAYDEENLYIGARAFDPEPEKIIAILTRRDTYTQSDWMYVSIDSYNDNRTAFEFGINPAGVKHDVRRFDDENMDADWDAVWDARSQIDKKGWTAEWKIPFRELRFNNDDNMEWGLQFYREFPRHDNELSMWAYWSQSDEGFVSNYGKLHGLHNVKVKKPIYFMPYVAGQAKVSDNLINPANDDNYDLLSNLGGDFRYCLPMGLTLNATINPDFGQVEADPSDFNLTEFETYFSEKRPFFMEGANILRYSLGFGDGDNQNNSLFYSRRIGRSPQGYLHSEGNKEVVATTRPELTNILGAAKITGKTTNGLSIGIMESVTSQEKGKIFYNDGSQESQIIEPLSNYWLGRFQQDYNEGNTTIGGIFTAVNRRLDGTGIDLLHKAAYTGGMDIDYEFYDRKYSFIGAMAFSNVQGDTTAIQRTQKSPVRYYNRTDATHLEYDPTATSLSGYAVKAILTKNTGHIRAAVGNTISSPGFEVNDLGFMQNIDNINQFVWVQYYQWEPNKILRNYRLNFNEWSNWDFSGMRRSLGSNINMHFTFTNSWSFGYGINHGFGGYDPSMNRGGPALYIPRHTVVWAYGQTDGRKNLIFNVDGHTFTNPDDVKSFEVAPGITWRPKHNLQFSFNTSYNQLNDTWAWIGSTTDNLGNAQYYWSGLQQKTLRLTLRADLTLTPNLSIQYYAQPFFTAGEYFDYVELTDPRAKDYDDRFTPMGNSMWYDAENGAYVIDKGNDGEIDYSFNGYTDFNYKQLRSNLVVRWEYVTGSVVYLVWSQGFTDYERFQPFDFSRDYRTLLNTTGDNVFMIKLSHLLHL